MKTIYERSFMLHADPLITGKVTIEMGLSQWELVLYLNDERTVIATKNWRVPAFELAAIIQEGAERLQKLDARAL